MTALIRIDRSWTATGSERTRPIRFCSRCGQPSEDPPRGVRAGPRVCDHCGMGLMLSCAREALPGTRAAFAIVTFELTLSAVSESGERIFGPEQGLIGTHLLDVMTSPLGDEQLARSVGRAAQRPCDPLVMPVRLRSERAGDVGTMAARIATCGPPRASLITVEPSEFGRS
jgi:hypothetical protein